MNFYVLLSYMEIFYAIDLLFTWHKGRFLRFPLLCEHVYVSVVLPECLCCDHRSPIVVLDSKPFVWPS